MENVHTKCNKALIVLEFNTSVVYSAVQLHSAFQVHGKGEAYRYSKIQSYFPSNWYVNAGPSFTQYTKYSSEFVWYLSNYIMTSKKEHLHSYTHQTHFISQWMITVNSYIP